MTRTMTRKSFLGAALAAAAFAGLTAGAQAQTKTLRLSHHLAPDHLVDVASKRFAALVAEKTGGKLKVDIFPAGQIAGLRQGAEAVQVGTLDLVWADFGTLANWQRHLGFISLPYLFRDTAHVNAAFDGPIGQELAAEVRKTLNIEILGYGVAGFRVTMSRVKEINKPEDLAGQKIRVPEVPVYVSSFRKIGANPTPMAWGEVYTALQTGVIEAVENPPEGLAVGRMQEVTKFAAKTDHIMTDVHLMMSASVLSGLPADQQAAVKEAAKTALMEFNKATEAASGDYWKKLAATVKANETPDREAFRKAMMPVWEELDKAAGGKMKPWVDRIVAVK
ncbi:MAG: TRAP transporter substrate-binding protein [Methylobacteriaceae bacterium]|nr:TRAP transporter substrate-binding protein [Methylobacteriaceae bacterium]